ncbi:bacillithiol biosynthesis cysteine-adding enzyme BshC [Mesobacillus maritimus]|uniref:Putative cysteine ligase BshC n=1 Tax=Mesobacillus maritimus TaxID=1643336 RepID=A0ABS7K6Q8_9BACI|nr:bacillithiol biosynthesis cysteine-adding enzyme BshC [Mesobacillus maritimus]MBY0097775.1 bacillithiol biosynthesis cysteine-adding enzyme BshC [Mesobacillus maritimus]
MEILNLSLPAANRFATGYLEGDAEIQSFFHYNYQMDSDYKTRLEELSTRKFYRQEIAQHIEHFMSRFPSSDQVMKNIEKLKLKNSVAVIGGQQAGLLTGPLYSVHKVISIIKLAEQKEQELGVPVVPVFWIAGEDHDYQEVNHVYALRNDKPEKILYPEKNLQKCMISDTMLNREKCLSWVEDIIESFGETHYTNSIREFTKKALDVSETFVDFFAMIIMEMFKDHGLLIIDSGDRELRRYESEFFIKQLNQHAEITIKVKNQQQIISKAGFKPAIDIGEDAANLFYTDPITNERVLLQYEPINGVFFGKNGEVSLTKDELLTIATEFPERLSNNVVTRPLMQEWLFPTIAFIGGPGEIAYWAELKTVFEHFNMKMPPLVPRLNITILDRSIETDLDELDLDLQEVLEHGTNQHELKFIDSMKDRELEDLLNEAKNQLKTQYELIRSKSAHVDKALLPLVEKNEKIILKQIEFMEKKVYESVCRKHDHVLKKFSRVENALRPNGSPQERLWNPFYYLNKHGIDFFSAVLTLSFKFDGTHKVIKV